MLAYIVIAAIVLFQSDIRRALSHLGRAPFFRYLYLGQSEHAAETIEEVITASALLAKAKVGAIIVFEREIGLRNYVESGIPIDSTVSYDLLTNIFQPGTPLHDGAVIISEDRIAAAACFLPLAVSPKLDRDLGTRHRAAIGLTEETDAIAVVVISEERGEISLARHGQISRRLVDRGASRQVADADSSAAAQPRSERRRRRRGRLMAWHPFRNVGLKVAALVLGTLLWLTVSGHEIERRVRVPVSYSSMPAGLEMTSDQDDVSVHVRGTDTEVSGLGSGRPSRHRRSRRRPSGHEPDAAAA